MESPNLYFVGQHQVEMITEHLTKPGPKEVLVKASKSLISTGTETICLERRFESGSHWDRWVQYPSAQDTAMPRRWWKSAATCKISSLATAW